MKKFKYLLAILISIPVAVLIALGISSTDASGYSMVSNKVSPSGQYTVYAIDSISEEGHAPHGQHLVLSDKKFVLKPDSGYVIFAGYCLPPLIYEWRSDNHIRVQCKVNEKEKVHTRTRAAIVHGINVEVQYAK